jgi:hypothetical protein
MGEWVKLAQFSLSVFAISPRDLYEPRKTYIAYGNSNIAYSDWRRYHGQHFHAQ